MIKRICVSALAILLTTSTVLASGVPVSCNNGTRLEPVAPTIIPGYTEIVPDIYHEEQIIENPDKVVRQAKFRWNKFKEDVCIRPNGWRSPDYKADCLTLHDTASMGVERSTRKWIPVDPTIIDAWTEEVADIDHPEQVIENPPVTVNTKTVKYLVGLDKWLKPIYRTETSDGQCRH